MRVPRPDLIDLIDFIDLLVLIVLIHNGPGDRFGTNSTFDLNGLIDLIHNGLRCELKQLNQLNRPRPDLIVLIVLLVLIVLIHNGSGDRFGTQKHIDCIDLIVLIYSGPVVN